MKPPKSKDLPVIVKELFCRVGQDWIGKCLFIGKLTSLDSEIAYAVAKELNISPEDLHSLTCSIETRGIKTLKKSSITGDDYLARKILKLKIRVTIEECELIDDLPVEL